MTYLGAAKDPWGNARVGFEAEMTINRKDFGLNWNAALETGGFLVGDDVKISVSIQAIAQTSPPERGPRSKSVYRLHRHSHWSLARCRIRGSSSTSR